MIDDDEDTEDTVKHVLVHNWFTYTLYLFFNFLIVVVVIGVLLACHFSAAINEYIHSKSVPCNCK